MLSLLVLFDVTHDGTDVTAVTVQDELKTNKSQFLDMAKQTHLHATVGGL